MYKSIVNKSKLLNSVGSNPKIMQFGTTLNLTVRTSNSLEPRFVHQTQTSNPFKPLQKAWTSLLFTVCLARNWLNPDRTQIQIWKNWTLNPSEPKFVYQNQPTQTLQKSWILWV